jgi:group I intron endonuclease
MKIGIYKITNKINGKCYIGSSLNITKRKNKHFGGLKLNIHPNKHLQSAYNKYGFENFTFEIIEETEKTNLLLKEQYYIDTLRPEYNKRLIAESNLGIKFCVEARNNMSIAMSGKGNNFYNRKHSKETKDKMRKKKIGVKQSEETKIKRISKLNKKIFQFDIGYNFIREYESLKELCNINSFNYKWFIEARYKYNKFYKSYYWLNSKEEILSFIK